MRKRKIEMTWAREETRPIIRRKKDSGEEKGEDRSRDGLIVLAVTSNLSGHQKIKYMT